MHAISPTRAFSDQAHQVAFPLGGVCASSISLGGRGQLRDWEIFNRPDKGNAPSYAFPAIWAQTGAGKPVARLVAVRGPAKPRTPGSMAGQIHIAPDFDALPDQFIPGVSEHSFGLCVDLNNDALLIDCSNGVGNRLQNGR